MARASHDGAMEARGEPPPRSTPVGLKVVAVLLALVVVPGGAFLLAANVGTGGRVAIAAAVGWWLVTSAVIGKFVLQRRADLRTPVWATLALAAIASVATAYVITRPSEVDEAVATGAPGAQLADGADRDAALARAEPAPNGDGGKAPAENVQLLSGAFTGESGHRGEGKAAVLRLAQGGRVVTFTEFDVDPGAGGLRVYLHAGETTSDDLGDFVEIAKLKGTKGDQQYEIPADLDLRRYSTVVIWCVPFSTRIAQAPLS